MRIAFVTTQDLRPQISGVHVQARTWRKLLEESGIEVELINPWHPAKWKEFTAVHIFGGGAWMPHFVVSAKEAGVKIVHSPMIDTGKNLLLYRLLAHLPHFRHKVHTQPSINRYNNVHSAMCLARSRDEARILTKGLGVPCERVRIVPICINTSECEPMPPAKMVELPARFCLHASQFTQARKNIVRISQACMEVGLPLVVCGNPESEQRLREIQTQVGEARVIWLSYVSRPELIWLFKHCAAFALPSLYEGVGLAALEACYHGAEVVVSLRGGAPDYFGQFGHYANPLSVASIGGALSRAVSEPRQPGASQHVAANYTENATRAVLIEAYRECLKQNE